MNLRGSNWTLGLFAINPISGIAAEQTDCGAVLGRDRVEVVGGAQAAGARHVLHHDIGIARNVAAQMTRQQARDDVVTAARPVADDHIDLLALVEIFDRALSERRYGKGYCGDQQRRDEAYRDLAHGSLDLSCPGLTRASILLAKKMDCRAISAFTRVFNALCPAMTAVDNRSCARSHVTPRRRRTARGSPFAARCAAAA